MSPASGGPARSHGFTYLGVLFIVSLLAMTSAMASVVWNTAQQRDNERELVFIGRQFAAAIERYRAQSTNPALPYPRRLEDLLRDGRGVTPQHHLRRLYVDPITGDAQWGLIRLPDGGIVGVHSLSERMPFPRKYVVAGYPAPKASSYRDWRFIAPGAVGLLDALPLNKPTKPSPPAKAPEGVAASIPDANPDQDEPEAQPQDDLQPPTLDDYETQTPEACSRIASRDDQLCADQGTRLGDVAGTECRDSALARQIACALGKRGLLPRLVVRDN